MDLEICSVSYHKVITNSDEITVLKDCDNAEDIIRLEFIKAKISYINSKMKIINEQLDIVRTKFDTIKKYMVLMDKSNLEHVEFFYEFLFLEKKKFEDLTKDSQDCQKELTENELCLKDRLEWLALKEKWYY